MSGAGWKACGAGAGAVVVALGLLFVARGQHAGPGGGTRPTGEPRGLPGRQEFRNSAIGLAAAEVRRRLGEPAEVVTPVTASSPDDPAEGAWRYPGVCRDEATGTADQAAWLWTRRGRVSEVTFVP
jgi:hypothetical protein